MLDDIFASKSQILWFFFSKNMEFDLTSVDFDLKSVDSDLKFYNLSKNIWFKSLENVKGSDLNGDE